MSDACALKWVVTLLVFGLTAGAAHMATLNALPGVIMDRAMTTMAERGVPLHGFVLAPAATPRNQTVVRPSPDLAYSICRFDLRDAPEGLTIRAGAFEGYGSISVFDARTNNIGSIRIPAGEEVSAALSKTPGADVVATSDRGLILIRRLAPTPEARIRAEDASQRDACASTKE